MGKTKKLRENEFRIVFKGDAEHYPPSGDPDQEKKRKEFQKAAEKVVKILGGAMASILADEAPLTVNSEYSGQFKIHDEVDVEA